MGRYVFPDGELLDVADTVSSMERAGFEVRWASTKCSASSRRRAAPAACRSRATAG